LTQSFQTLPFKNRKTPKFKTLKLNQEYNYQQPIPKSVKKLRMSDLASFGSKSKLLASFATRNNLGCVSLFLPFVEASVICQIFTKELYLSPN